MKDQPQSATISQHVPIFFAQPERARPFLRDGRLDTDACLQALRDQTPTPNQILSENAGPFGRLFAALFGWRSYAESLLGSQAREREQAARLIHEGQIIPGVVMSSSLDIEKYWSVRDWHDDFHLIAAIRVHYKLRLEAGWVMGVYTCEVERSFHGVAIINETEDVRRNTAAWRAKHEPALPAAGTTVYVLYRTDTDHRLL